MVNGRFELRAHLGLRFDPEVGQVGKGGQALQVRPNRVRKVVAAAIKRVLDVFDDAVASRH